MNRGVALKLACANESDRKAILGRLTPDERRVVESALKEIESLGLNKDPAAISAFFSTQDRKEKARILPSELKGIQNIESLDPFWQVMLLGCLETTERTSIKKKYGLTSDAEDAIDNIPAELKLLFIAALKSKKTDGHL